MIKLYDPISLIEAAVLFGETPENFRHFIKRGETPEPIRIGKHVFFEREEIIKWEKPHKARGGFRPRKKK